MLFRTILFGSLITAPLSLAAVPALAEPEMVTATAMTQYAGDNAGAYNAGRSMAKGDVNGDGYEDLVVGAHANSGSAPGYVYVLYGQADLLAGSSVASDGVIITGSSNGDQTGYAVATGDLDADGYDDILIGANKNDSAFTDAGTVTIIYGQADTLTASTLNANSFAQITGEVASNQFGDAIVTGDFNGDGYQDFAIGATKNADGGASEAGAVYIGYGSATRRSVGTASASTLVEYTHSTASAALGVSLAARDLDLDGFADLVMGSAASPNGAAYLVYGQSADLPGGSITTAITYTGEVAADQFGSAVATGDIDGDGYAEVLVSAAVNDDAGSNAGAMYVFPGQSTPLAGGTAGDAGVVEFTGELTTDQLNIITTGDLNNDGYEDIIVSSTINADGGTNAGSAYVVLGQADSLTSSSIQDASSIEFTGTNSLDAFGRSLATPDLNGDGVDDLAVGAPQYVSTAAQGSIYFAYLGVDVDGDGLFSGDGLVFDGTDTDDTIRNNGVEIGGDSIDNDGDADIDEVNTLSENGLHPEYSTYDPTVADQVSSAIISVTAKRSGKVRVTYQDDSVYVYTVFRGVDGKPKMIQVNQTGYYAVLDRGGKKLALLNVLNGDKTDRAKLTQAGYHKHFLQIADLRNNNKPDLVITSKQGDTVRIATAQINVQQASWKYLQSIELAAPDARITRTSISGNTIKVRSADAVIARIRMKANHHLIQL